MNTDTNGRAGESAAGYIAGWNMPGYLPEVEPESFETLDDAARYLQDTVEQWADQDEQDAPLIERGPDWAEGWYQADSGGAEYHLWAERITNER